MHKKLYASGYGTGKPAQFLKNYERLFGPLIDKEIKLLEIGVHKGGSLLLWRDYFEKAIIVGLDRTPVKVEDQTGRIHVYHGKQQDTALLSHIAQEMAPEGFDVIIDDCSHIAELTRISFWHLFDNHLKPGGLYIIEDWGTGYWNNWVDGKQYKPWRKPILHSARSCLAAFVGSILKNRSGLWPRLYKLAYYKQEFSSHNYGMVGFIKQLVDECGTRAIIGLDGGRPPRPSKFQRMCISDLQVIVVKSF